MKKNVLLVIVAFFVAILLKAQVGINTATPKASLEVVAIPLDTVVAGILVPRLTQAELAAKDAIYTADQHGALVFITNNSTQTGKTSNITTSGFHYYDHPNSLWRPITFNTSGSFIPIVLKIGSVPLDWDWSNYTNYNYFELGERDLANSALPFPLPKDFPNKTIYFNHTSSTIDSYRSFNMDNIVSNQIQGLGGIGFITANTTMQFYSDGVRWYLIAGNPGILQ